MLQVGQVVALSATLAACGGSLATPGSSPTQDSGATGPKCGPHLTQLTDAHGLLPPDAGAFAVAQPTDLAVSDGDLYVAVLYGGPAALLRVPIRGGPAVWMATIAGDEEGLLVTGDSVVFVQAHPPSGGQYALDVVRIGLQGGDTTVLASAFRSASSPWGGILATDGQNVYFAAQDGTKSVPLAGGPLRTLTPHTGSLAVVGSSVVVADTAAEAVFGVPIGGGAEVTLASSLTGDLGPVVGCGSSVCWASAVPVGASQQGTAAIVQLGPGGVPVTLSEDPLLYFPRLLLFDGSDFYAATVQDASAGSVVKVPGAGGAPVPLGFGGAVAIDDECLYLGDAAGGIYSVAKSYAGGGG